MMPITEAEVERRLNSHPTTPEQTATILHLTSAFVAMGKLLVRNVPQGRELATALTHLEQAKFIAVAGVARPGV